MQVINDNMIFNDYWKEKSTKRKKLWAAKAKRFAEQHAQLEAIRKDVYLPLDYGVNFSFEDYKPAHYTLQNPIACWQELNFWFLEDGLRTALASEGADMRSFKMEVRHQSIKGLEAPQPRILWPEPYRFAPNKVYDYETMYHDWLQWMYAICTDLETVSLSYKQITMTIKRYSTEGLPFGYYELNPCEQLTKSAMLLQETDFYTLNVATLLMEMAAEWELRQEEFNYYAKKLKLRTMEAVTLDSIEFDLWDEKKLEKKIPEYITKDYNVDKIIEQVSRPWKSAVKKFFDAAQERSLRDQTETLEKFSFRNSTSDRFVEECLRPYLESVGLQEVALVVPGMDHPDVILKYQGCQLRLSSYYWSLYKNDIFFYPNSYYDGCLLDLAKNTPLSAIGDYLKLMPTANQKMDETILKVLHIYDQQMQQNEKYHAAVEQLEALAQQYAGKPVGKMMKYLRWEAGRLVNGGYRIPLIPTIKVVSDNAFSFLEEKRFGGIVSQEEVMGWVDADCHNVYASDPSAPDPEGKRLPSRTVQEFIRQYGHSDPEPILAIDFIEQKL